MKSYIEYTNERARIANARADAGLDITMIHKDIHCGSDAMPETDQERQKRTGLSSLEISDQAAAAVQKTEHRVTLDSMQAKIADEEFIHPRTMPHMTICILTTDNGFALVGKSTPADPENFNEDLGKKFAREDALRQMWPLEAYLLREILSK